eukprot:5472406-Alexandrium_andersonii.AAC.1
MLLAFVAGSNCAGRMLCHCRCAVIELFASHGAPKAPVRNPFKARLSCNPPQSAIRPADHATS